MKNLNSEIRTKIENQAVRVCRSADGVVEFEPLQPDTINPSHYRQGKVECIDGIESALTPEEFRGYLKGNAMKYIWRERHKNGIEDLKKARWYLDRLIGEMEGE